MAKARYTAKDITVLEGLDPVRKRPAMYIGDTGARGMHHLLWELVDNGVDEVINGYADTISVTLATDRRTVTVKDNGRGIPVDRHPKFRKSALEIILTTLHAGAKFEQGSYMRSGGLHGVGASVVNALSEKLSVTVTRGGKRYQMDFRRGAPRGKLRCISSRMRGSGTEITFTPDERVFGATRFDPAAIRTRLDSAAYLHSGLKVSWRDQASRTTETFEHTGGLEEYLRHLVAARKLTTTHDEIFTLERRNSEWMDLALVWTVSTDTDLRTFANGIPTTSGGTHEAGLRSGILKAVRNYMEAHKLTPKGVSITADDIREGVVGVLSVFVQQPQFQGQTKDRLNNPELTPFVEGSVRTALEQWLHENRSVADAILGRIILAARAREASRQAVTSVRRKSAVSHRLNLPGKLADCSTTDPGRAELFIVEGESAGGSAKQGRDRETQAVLPLRGKVLNTEQASLTRVLENKELQDLVQALGTGIGKGFDLLKLRYGKICLLMDADSDGHHIATLLLTFFYRHMPELIRHGHVYLAQPPLYRVEVGKQVLYALSDREKERILARVEPTNGKPSIMRFKGLGEMSPQQLKETTLDPRTRSLLRVRVKNETEANNTLVELLGKDPQARATFITAHADDAEPEGLDL